MYTVECINKNGEVGVRIATVTSEQAALDASARYQESDPEISHVIYRRDITGSTVVAVQNGTDTESLDRWAASIEGRKAAGLTLADKEIGKLESAVAEARRRGDYGAAGKLAATLDVVKFHNRGGVR